MPQVYNWQLGRKMEYPYEERHPKSQFAFVFNTNRCIACQTCTMACKSTWTFGKGQEAMWWNNVETKPYGGYPQFWDIKTLKLLDDAHQKAGTPMTWDPARQGLPAVLGHQDPQAAGRRPPEGRRGRNLGSGQAGPCQTLRGVLGHDAL